MNDVDRDFDLHSDCCGNVSVCVEVCRKGERRGTVIIDDVGDSDDHGASHGGGWVVMIMGGWGRGVHGIGDNVGDDRLR